MIRSMPDPSPTTTLVQSRTDVSAIPKEWDGIQAVRLNNPDLNVTPKKDKWCQWVNFKYGDDQSPYRYQEAVSTGFRNATPDDLVGKCPYWDDKQRAFIKGDLILMTIERKLVIQNQKAEWEEANRRIMSQKERWQRETIAGAPGQRPAASGYVPEFTMQQG